MAWRTGRTLLPMTGLHASLRLTSLLCQVSVIMSKSACQVFAAMSFHTASYQCWFTYELCSLVVSDAYSRKQPIELAVQPCDA